MRYLSVVILSLVILVLELGTSDAAPTTQQVTISNANKKDLCRPGMVFIPSTGKCGCPKTQYQDMNLSSGSRTVGDCKTLKHILESRLEQEVAMTNNKECTSSDSAMGFQFSTTSQRVHDVVPTRNGFIAVGYSSGSGRWSIQNYDKHGTKLDRLLDMSNSDTSFNSISSIKLAALPNGSVMILLNAKGPQDTYHLYANIIDTKGNKLYQDEWRLIPLNMEKETVFDVINIGGTFMVAYAAPEYPNATDTGTVEAIVGFVLNKHLAFIKAPRVITSIDTMFMQNAATDFGYEPFALSLERAGYNKILMNYVPQSAPYKSHISGYLLDYELGIISEYGNGGSGYERVENGGFFALSEDSILAVSALQTVDGEIIVKTFNDMLSYHGEVYPRPQQNEKTNLQIMGRKSFFNGDAYAVSWRDKEGSGLNDYYLSLFYQDHTPMGDAIKLGANTDEAGFIVNSLFVGRYLSNQLYTLSNGDLLAAWGTKFRIINGVTPDCHLIAAQEVTDL